MSIEKKLALLRRAKIELKTNPNQSGVCLALAQAQKHLGDEYDSAHMALKIYIMDALDNHTYLSDWLTVNGMVDIAKDAVRIKRARLQWCDWMIECLKEHLPCP